ncbi:MAG: hypothetical protein V3U88_03835 [Methylococcales bacterium]
MLPKLTICSSILVMSSGLFSFSAHAVSNEEIARQLQENTRRLNQLELENQKLRSANEAMRQQLDNTKAIVSDTSNAVEVLHDNIDSQSKGDHWTDRVTIGGYGELHYNNLNNKPGKDEDGNHHEIDFHRFVLFVGYHFNDRLRMYSELEVEHAFSGDGAPGEVELEQAYIEYDLLDKPMYGITQSSIRGGLFLIPVGFLNETHEPPTFYGVERNSVENVIVPTTWWEAGVGNTTNFDNGISLDLAFTNGLNIPGEGGSAFRVRSGRQKGAKAQISDFAYTGRIKYTGVPGLRVAAAYQYQTDMAQSNVEGIGSGMLFETDFSYEHNLGPGSAMIKALWARWDIEGAAVEAANADEQYGWFVEPSYRMPVAAIGELGVYGRYQKVHGWRTADRFQQWEGGVNWWPVNNVVLKADYRFNQNDRDNGYNFQGFDLGIGYQF